VQQNSGGNSEPLIRPTKAKIDYLETNTKTKNIRDLYKGINHLRKVTSLELMWYRMRRVIWLQTATVFWLGGGNISQLFSVQGVSVVRQTEIYTVESLVPEPSTFEVEMAIENLKRHKLPGIDQIPA
jgi:hypothetical protein